MSVKRQTIAWEEWLSAWLPFAADKINNRLTWPVNYLLRIS
jgi:hypothetical protein